jgi:hypothetical protein
MGSIGSPNIVNPVLISQIQKLKAAQGQTGPSASAATSTASSDQVDFSQIANFFKQLQQLQQSNPAQFKQVLTDTASKLKAAAGQSTDPQQAAFLNNLAGKFQTAADTGDLSALKPDSNGSSTANTQPYGGRAHGHHRHAETAGLVANILGTPATTSNSSATNEIQSLLSALVS